MAISDATIKRLTESPSPELLDRVARELYELEPINYGGQYGGPDQILAWDGTGLSDEARAKCIQYAGTVIAAWQRAVMEQSAG